MRHDIKIQNIPDLKKTIGFSLLAIREAKKKGVNVNIELNLTNAKTFPVHESVLFENKKYLDK